MVPHSCASFDSSGLAHEWATWRGVLCGGKGIERRSGDQRPRGPFGFAQGRLFDSGAHGEAVSAFAQDDRVGGRGCGVGAGLRPLRQMRGSFALRAQDDGEEQATTEADPCGMTKKKSNGKALTQSSQSKRSFAKVVLPGKATAKANAGSFAFGSG